MFGPGKIKTFRLHTSLKVPGCSVSNLVGNHDDMISCDGAKVIFLTLPTWFNSHRSR